MNLRQLMSHRGGLPAMRIGRAGRRHARLGVDGPGAGGPGALVDARRSHGYHVNTFGYLLGEPVRQAAGMTLGTLLRQEIAGPLGADIHIGLPQREHGRVADFLLPAAAPPGRVSRRPLEASDQPTSS